MKNKALSTRFPRYGKFFSGFSTLWKMAVIVSLSAGSAGYAQEWAVRSSLDDFASPGFVMAKDAEFGLGAYYTVTMSPGAYTPLEFKFASADENTWLGPYLGGPLVPVNVQVGGASWINQNFHFNTQAGRYYSFRAKFYPNPGDVRETMADAAVMETTAAPVAIETVADDSEVVGGGNVTVSMTLSDLPGGEAVYVRYSANGWSSSSLAKAAVDGVNAVATIPGQANGTVVEYYALTSTITNLNAGGYDVDLFTLRGKKDGADNFTYTVTQADPVVGNVWHCPTNAEPWEVGMRDPLTPHAESDVWIRVGSSSYVNESIQNADMTGGKLMYRINGSIWVEDLRLEGEDTDTAPNAGLNNAFWRGVITNTHLKAGDVVDYVLMAEFLNQTNVLKTTYVGTTDQLTSMAYGTKEEAQAHAFTFTVAAPPLLPMGNVWHYPTNQEPWAVSMCDPLPPVEGAGAWIRVGTSGTIPDTDITDADMTGGVLCYSIDSGSWNSVPLVGEDVSGAPNNPYGNAYWYGIVPGTALAAGNTLYYYIRTDFANNSGEVATTYIGKGAAGSNLLCRTEAEARSNVFAAVVIEKTPGNVWHYPGNEEPWANTTMRFPETPFKETDLWIRMGAFPKAGNASATRVTLHYSVHSLTAWSSLNMTGENTEGSDYPDNAYWAGTIPAAALTGTGLDIRYYFAVKYSNDLTTATTYLGFAGGSNVAYRSEASAKNNPFMTTVTNNPGNAWHVAGAFEPWPDATMRHPMYPFRSDDVCFFVGNQARGTDGTPGNMTGGNLYYRPKGTTAWMLPVALTYEEAPQGNNKYWKAVLPASNYGDASDMEYYFEVKYETAAEGAPKRDTTYLGRSGSGAQSAVYATATEAQAHLFEFPIGGEAGTEPGFIWHAGNVVRLDDRRVQAWVKTGYVSDEGSNWVDHVELRYNFKDMTTDPLPAAVQSRAGVTRVSESKALAEYDTAPFVSSHLEQDVSEHGNSMWWMCTLEGDEFTNMNYYLEYQIAAWKETDSGGNGAIRFADYKTSSATNTFYFTMWSEGADALTINGVNADYTTSKFFIDEAAGETVTLEVWYSPPTPESGTITDVQIFSNVGRRDFWNADVDGDGVYDSIRPPSGDAVTPETVDGYYVAIPMESRVDGYHASITVDRCGAYRLTGRYKVSGDEAWHYYSEIGSGRRDHAVVISPRKTLQQNVYELNALTVKAAAATESGRSTFAKLIEVDDAAGHADDPFGEFSIDYLNRIQANCLWFQPIHTSSEYGLKEGGEPGSPYAAKDYFAVSKWFGADKTTAGALSEFQQFVAACDAGKSAGMAAKHVGTINIMLDGVFNHTSWDAVLGDWGVELLNSKGVFLDKNGNPLTATTPIGFVRPGWYANYSNYGAPATYYDGPAGGQHDIACGPDRGDFGKWLDTAEFFYGRYAALVEHNPDSNSQYLSEADWYDYSSMGSDTIELWEYMGKYPEYWLEKTGHPGSNTYEYVDGILQDDLGIDGLRCDFGQGLPPQFWEYIINRTRATKWNFMFMAESLDGGNVSYRSNRHFDILNESFVFQMVGAQNPGNVKDALESRKSMYSGGAVLLNLTSHDEIMPFEDPWVTASRFAMVSSVMGLPMTFFGQEQGIGPNTASKDGHGAGDSIAGNQWNGFATFELNMGKWVPHFKEWNQLLIWDNPPSADWSRDMAQWYGRVGWARLNSPALQSGNQYFLGRKGHADGDGGSYDNDRIFAVAKVEEPGAVANGKDAVLAFSLFLHHADHMAMDETYDMAACAEFLGIENSAEVYYNVRNLAASDAAAYIWSTPQSGKKLIEEGIWINLFAESDERNLYEDGSIVQYLKIEEVEAPAITDIQIVFSPTNNPLAVAYQTTAAFAVSVVDNNAEPVDTPVAMQTAVPGATFADGGFSYVITDTAWVGVTNPVVFTAAFDGLNATNTMNIMVPVDANANGIADIWEWAQFAGYTNTAAGDFDSDGLTNYEEYVLDTNPTMATAPFGFTGIASDGRVTVVKDGSEPRKYTFEFATGMDEATPSLNFGNPQVVTSSTANIQVELPLAVTSAPAVFYRIIQVEP